MHEKSHVKKKEESLPKKKIGKNENQAYDFWWQSYINCAIKNKNLFCFKWFLVFLFLMKKPNSIAWGRGYA